MQEAQQSRGVAVEDALAPPAEVLRRLGARIVFIRLGLLCAILYCMQGLLEPTDGIGAQPVRSLLKGWGNSPAQITAFVAWASIPWSLKVLYGLFVDFLPLWGSRRRSYLLLSISVCAAGMLGLYLLAQRGQFHHVFLVCLILLSAAIAISDVATDAMMVEIGQPLGLTGQLQAIQWTSLFVASSAAGYVGGLLSIDGRQRLAFLCCGVLALVALPAVLATKVPEQPAPPQQGLRQAVSDLVAGGRTPAMLSMAAFLFLWAFNPFSQSLLYLHMTQQLGVSEVFYGKTVSYLSIASCIASAGYGFYCRWLSPGALIHSTIVLGAISTLAYLFLRTENSAIAVTLFVGITYQTAVMMQLDLAARVCPIRIAGTAFALLMGLSNLSASISTYVGGSLYEKWLPRFGAQGAFLGILLAGAALNMSCWLLLPYLKPVRAT